MALTREQHLNAQRAIGLAYIFATAVIWTASSFISQSIVSEPDPCNSTKDTEQNDSAIPPFVLTYLATSLFVVYLPIIYGFRCAQVGGVKAFLARVTSSSSAQELETLNFNDTADETSLLPHPTPSVTSVWAKEDREAFWAALTAFPLWFCAQWLFNLSLAWTSVTSNTILSSTSSLFAFLLSLWVLGEQYTNKKLLCVVLCIGGTALVTISDDKQPTCPGAPPAPPGQPTRAALGDLMAVASAALYAFYTVLMRKQLPDEAAANVGLFFGYIGLFAFVVFAPVVAVMVAMGVFRPSQVSRETYGLILLEGALDYVLADYLWARAVLLIGPTIATLGLSVQIPVATTVDLMLGKPAWIHRQRSIAAMVSGTTLILLGFFGVNTGKAEQHGKAHAEELPRVLPSVASSERGDSEAAATGTDGSGRGTAVGQEQQGQGAGTGGTGGQGLTQASPLKAEEVDAAAASRQEVRGSSSNSSSTRQPSRSRRGGSLSRSGSGGDTASLLLQRSASPTRHSPARHRT